LSPIPSCEAVPPPPRSTPCPYTTLFRSDRQGPDPGATPGRGHRCTVRAVGADAPRSRGLPGRGLPLGTVAPRHPTRGQARRGGGDRKSTRLNSSHVSISYAVFCLKKKKK